MMHELMATEVELIMNVKGSSCFSLFASGGRCSVCWFISLANVCSIREAMWCLGLVECAALPLFSKPGNVGGIRPRSVKSREVRERSGNLCGQGNSIVTSQ